MYARVAVASNALDLSTIPPPAANAFHEALIQMLHAHGRLVFASNQEALEFVRAIKGAAAMSPGARVRWDALFVHLRNSRRVSVADPPSQDTLAATVAIDRLRAGWGPQADVAVVAQAVCAALGVPGDTGILSAPGSNPDVAMAFTAPNAPAIARIIEQEQNPVAAHGSPREGFWADVLEPMATGAIEATVVDGYLFNRITDLADGRGRDTGKPEHVCWLLDHLDSVMAGQATVRLVGNKTKLSTSGHNAQTIAELIHERWSPLKVGRLAAVEVYLADPASGRSRFPHDRHIRFSTDGAIKVHAGFDRLREDRIWDTSGMSWNYLWHKNALDALREDERSAVALARHPAAMALSR